MENMPAGAGPIEEAVSDISSVVSLFSQVKSYASSAKQAAKKTFLYLSVAWWIFAGVVGFIHKRRKSRKH